MLNSSRRSLSKYTEKTVNEVSREMRLGIFSSSSSSAITEVTSRPSSARMASSSASDAALLAAPVGAGSVIVRVLRGNHEGHDLSFVFLVVAFACYWAVVPPFPRVYFVTQ